jgi:hypothetical protein
MTIHATLIVHCDAFDNARNDNDCDITQHVIDAIDARFDNVHVIARDDDTLYIQFTINNTS